MKIINTTITILGYPTISKASYYTDVLSYFYLTYNLPDSGSTSSPPSKIYNRNWVVGQARNTDSDVLPLLSLP